MKATGHDYGSNITTAATCTKDGVKTYTCKKCSDKYTESIAKLGHYYESKVTAPTCTAQGYTTHTCKRCNNSYKDNYTAVKPHNYVAKVTKEATCTTDGVKTHTCSGCGDAYTESIAKFGHYYKSVVTSPTCTAQGYTTHTCSRCQNSYKDTYTAKVDHSYKKAVVAPTCEKDGYTKYTCSNCSASYQTDTVTAFGHNYEFTSDTATCTRDGIRTETCKNCYNKKTTTSKATGHLNTYTQTKEATCEASGYVKVICYDCGNTISTKEIAILSCEFETWSLPRAAEELITPSDFTQTWLNYYKNWEDHTIQVCKNCHYADEDTIVFKHTDMAACEIMLGYVNELRRSVYGSNRYDLVIDTTLLELAKIRAKEIAVNYAHGGTYTNARENITGTGFSISEHYDAWLNSKGHYNTMVDKSQVYFAYATYKDEGSFYGVQLFWSSSTRREYYFDMGLGEPN